MTGEAGPPGRHPAGDRAAVGVHVAGDHRSSRSSPSRPSTATTLTTGGRRPGPRPRALDAGRGQRLPAGGRPGRRRPPLRPRPDLVARAEDAGGAGHADLPGDRRRAALPGRPGPAPRGLGRDPRRRGRALRAAGQEPRGPGAGHRRPALRAGRRPTPALPEPVPAPTTRRDFSTTGLTTTDSGELWTMQEPFGAYTWYPVNDQPADKALYDITVHAPAPWTGIANGRLVDLTTTDDVTTTSWQLTEPASSYLLTLAVGDYVHSSNTTSSGLRVDYWTPRGMVQGARRAAGRRGVRRLGREQARPLPVRHPGHGRHRVEQRHGDPDHGHAGQHRVRPVAAGDRARAGPPVVRRPGLARRTGATCGSTRA